MNRLASNPLLPRLVMFLVMLGLVIYITQLVLSFPTDKTAGAVVVNPIIQLGLSFLLVSLGGLVGFWITFGDLVNRAAKK